MKKCRGSDGLVSAFVTAFLREVTAMSALTVKYYLFNLNKETIKNKHYTTLRVRNSQSRHSRHSLPLNPSLKPTQSRHVLVTFGGFLIA